MEDRGDDLDRLTGMGPAKLPVVRPAAKRKVQAAPLSAAELRALFGMGLSFGCVQLFFILYGRASDPSRSAHWFIVLGAMCVLALGAFVGVGLLASGLRQVPDQAGKGHTSGDLEELTLMERRRLGILRSRPPGFRITLGGIAASIVAVALALQWPMFFSLLMFLPVNWLLDRMVLGEPRRSQVLLSFMASFVVLGVIATIALR
jgi:hypothetical protein